MAILSLFVVIVYREWSRRQANIGQSPRHELCPPDSPSLHVDHMSPRVDSTRLATFISNPLDLSMKSLNDAADLNLRRSYSALCAEEADVPIGIMREALAEEGRDKAAKIKALSGARSIWNSQQSKSPRGYLYEQSSEQSFSDQTTSGSLTANSFDDESSGALSTRTDLSSEGLVPDNDSSAWDYQIEDIPLSVQSFDEESVDHRSLRRASHPLVFKRASSLEEGATSPAPSA